MKFYKIYGVLLVLSELFTFFGGWMLFDFSKNVYLTAAVWAFLLALLLDAFLRLEKRIDRLEKRVEELENGGTTEQKGGAK